MYVTKQTREQGEGHGREPSEREPIAIVGIGCRLPGGANDPKSFWKMLCQRVDAIMPAPAERGNANSFLGVDARSPGSTAVLWAGFIEGIDQFDPEFFGISVREAPCVDPQQRLLLEAAWEALEDGGQVLDPEIAARTGVFVGISGSDYSQLQIDVHDFSALDVHSVLGLSMSIAANRISYCLDLHGPSVAVDTACSSSLVAIHLACRSIWEGESGLALAGGVNALLTPAGFVPMAAASMLSPDGRCKTFDARANGFVRAEGVGVVALKPLAAALADGNPIYALIRGTAANQDGRTAGITVPNGAAQAALVREACRFAGVRPAEVHYVEAHGTGTSVGDPIEANALGQVLGAGRADGNECIIGSVKTNIGHLEAGAGVAGIIKTALVLEHHLVPPHLHLVEPNPLIDFERLKLKLPLEAEPLPSGRLLAGVNSFGFGGANAHAVLESWEGANGKHTECPASEDDSAQRTGPMRLLPLSAQSSESLVELARRYADFFRNRAATAASPEWLRDVCYSASFHRKHHHHRLIVVADSAESFADKLEAFASGESRPGLASGHITARRKIAFVFGGQGPQWWGMGRQLLAREPVFRETIEECDRLLERAGAKWSLVEELGEDEASSRIHDPAIAQPAIFALQVALAALWRSWGVEPQTVAGHSVGEVAAAHVGGALDLESAARVIFHRGRCMALAESGRMMAAAVSEEEATRLVAGVAGFASVAAVNSPSSVTLAGDAEPLAAIEEELSARGTFCRLLKVQYAFHSARMEPLREDLLGSIHGVEASPLRIPMWSTVTGAPAHGEPLGATYWWRNVREPVQFCAAARGLAESEHNVFVELSPHPVLLGYLRESMDGAATFATSLRRGEDECATMLTALGTLHAVGHRVGLRALYPDGGRCVRLPRYAWRHQRYWQELSSVTDARGSSNDHPLLGRAFRAARPYWEKKIGPELLAFLGDHRVQGHILFPAAGYLEMALAAGKRLFGTDVCTLEDVEFLNPLLLPESGEAPRLQLTYDAAEKEFAIASRASNAQKHWTLHCVGRLVPGAERSAAGFQDLGPAEERVRVPCSEELYARLDQMGLQYGLAFRRLQDLWRGDREAVGGVALPEEWDDTGYQVHPALLDGCFHAMLGADLSALDDGRSMLHLPARVRRVRLHSRPGPKVESRVRLVKRTPRALEVDVHVHDAAGSVALEIEGLTVLGSPSTRMSDRLERSIYAIEWQLKPRSPAERKITSADFLPALDEMAPLLERAMKRGHLGGSLRRMVEAEPDTDRLCVHYVVRAFEDLGVSLEVGARISVESVRARVAEAHQRVVERYLALLEAHGILVREGRDWRVREAPERVELEAFFRKVFAPFPNPGVMLLRSCGRELARLLRGEVDALLLLFGETSFLDLLYTESVEMRGPYRTARQMLRVAAERVPPHRRLRILEVGAGTGGTAGTESITLDPQPEK
jgi:acyl transferase domain-containing protein